MNSNNSTSNFNNYKTTSIAAASKLSVIATATGAAVTGQNGATTAVMVPEADSLWTIFSSTDETTTTTAATITAAATTTNNRINTLFQSIHKNQSHNIKKTQSNMCTIMNDVATSSSDDSKSMPFPTTTRKRPPPSLLVRNTTNTIHRSNNYKTTGMSSSSSYESNNGDDDDKITNPNQSKLIRKRKLSLLTSSTDKNNRMLYKQKQKQQQSQRPVLSSPLQSTTGTNRSLLIASSSLSSSLPVLPGETTYRNYFQRSNHNTTSATTSATTNHHSNHDVVSTNPNPTKRDTPKHTSKLSLPMIQLALNVIIEQYPSKMNNGSETFGPSTTLKQQNHSQMILNNVRDRLRNHDYDNSSRINYDTGKGNSRRKNDAKFTSPSYVRLHLTKNAIQQIFRNDPNSKSDSTRNGETTNNNEQQQQRHDKKLLHQLQKQRRVLQQQFNIEKNQYDSLYEKYEQLYDITTITSTPQEQQLQHQSFLGSDVEDDHSYHDEEKKNDVMVAADANDRPSTLLLSSTRPSIATHHPPYHPYLLYCQLQQQQADPSILDDCDNRSQPKQQPLLVLRPTPSQCMKTLFEMLQIPSSMDKESS